MKIYITEKKKKKENDWDQRKYKTANENHQRKNKKLPEEAFRHW